MSSVKKMHIDCFFNAPYLGGAERSFINQAQDLALMLKEGERDYDFRFIIPYLDRPGEDKKLTDLIISKGFRSQQIVYFKYHKGLFRISRSSRLLKWLTFLLLPYYAYCFLITLQNLNQLQYSEKAIWWVGGNKIGPVAFALSFLRGQSGRLLWHFRDYLSYGKAFSYFWQLTQLFSRASIEFIGNSHHVAASISKFIPSKDNLKKCWTLYNPIGDIKFTPTITQKNSDFILSTASMFAPWKGVHFLVHFGLLFEKELRALGVSEFRIYGDEIYKTTGVHHGYKDQLHTLTKNYKSDFVKFMGMKGPEEIFSESDIFIHGALRPEPFGRVLIESYRSGTPLISTGLGGAGELINDGSSALTYIPYDYYGLLECISKMCSQDKFHFIQEGRQKGDVIEKEYLSQLKEIFLIS